MFSDTAFSLKRTLTIFLLVFLPPNAIFICLTFFLGVERPLVNFDYAVAALLFPVLGWVAGALALFLAFVFDGIAIVGQILPFNRITDFFYFLPYWKHSPEKYQVFIVAILIFFLVVIALHRATLKRLDVSYLAIFNFLLVAFIFDSLLFPTANNWVWRVRDSGVVGSQVLFNFDSRDRAFFGFFDSDGDPFSEKDYKGLMSSVIGGDEDVQNFILVLNESWGASIDPALNYELMAPLIKAIKIRGGEFTIGQVDAEGPTIKGEFRELCDRELLHINIRDLGPHAEHCLPNRLRKNGFRTVSVHPASGLMYDRAYWYPFVGFEESIFFESARWDSRCYSFPGGCDIEVPEKVRSFFGGGDQVFLYWLTLNTHSVYDERDIVSSDFVCSNWDIDQKSSLCRYLKLQSQFFSTLAEMAKWPEMSGSEFLVIGDHAPPILEASYRGEFVDERAVSWIRFSIP